MRVVIWILAFVLAAVAALVLATVLLPRERIAEMVIEFDAAPTEVFSVYTDPQSQPRWRGGVESVEMIRTEFPRAWIERPRRGPAIAFEEIEALPNERYVLDLRAEGMFTGRYEATFKTIENGRTRGTFREQVTTSNPIASLTSRVFVNLEREIRTYAEEASAEIERRRASD